MYKGGPENLEALEGPECLTGPMEDPEGLKCQVDSEDLEGPERLEYREVLGGPEGLPGSVEDSECLIFPEHHENLGAPERLIDPEGLRGPGDSECRKI